MSEKLFRKQSLDKVTSPEQLNDYVRVSNPGVWMILTAVVILLVGVCVWGVFGRMESKLTTVGTAQDGVITCYVKADDIDRVTVGERVIIDGADYTTGEISPLPNAVATQKVLTAGGFSEDDRLYSVAVDADVPDGIYKVEFVTDSVSPISFVIN